MEKYKKFAKNFAKWSGQVILSNFTYKMMSKAKYDGSPVTKTDTAINKELIRQVKKYFPEHSVLGEEESYKGSKSEYAWVCDPVDGTIPFSHGIPICTFSLALTKNGKSILGVAYDPFGKNLFFASLGEGATLNGKPLRVSKTSEISGSLGEIEVFKSAKYDLSELGRQLIFKEKAHLIKLCSYVYPSTLVAAGELAFTIFPHTSAHDVAAVKIIVEEAGGKVTDIFGNDQRYDSDLNGAIVSNGLIHNQLVKLAKKLVKNK